MTTTLLAVDDSVTMRKVLEITFAGEDFRVVTAESADAALKKARADKPQIVVLDVSLPEMDGYAVCKTLKAEMPGVAVVLLSSKQGPYDAGRGSAAGADDFIDKPFDTQQMIDKVRKVAAAKAAQPQTAPPPGATAKPAAPEPPKAAGTLPGAGHAPVVPAPPAPRPQAASAPNRTQMFAGAPPMPAATPAPAPRPVATAPVASPPTPASGVARPAPSPVAPPVAPVAAAPAAAPSPVAAAVNGQLGDKLAGLGLSQAQADAVLALSREVVERIVWEVVPVLAETMIKEEIRRLTRDEALGAARGQLRARASPRRSPRHDPRRRRSPS